MAKVSKSRISIEKMVARQDELGVFKLEYRALSADHVLTKLVLAGELDEGTAIFRSIANWHDVLASGQITIEDFNILMSGHGGG